MTFKEVHTAYTSILKRRRQEIIIQAKIMGAKIDDDVEENGYQSEFINHDEVTPAQELFMQKSIQEHIAKKGLKRWQT